ncbi:hypothetical protein CROQUDRAFT_662135 [Cronartium quercuum f. sp. fusiforme G11]|uniref:THUMP domain-containing protein n=1 Tax=Cronartium quercuum f. sp. fusiforme G11 TaxID=708437 RepID=A0A9P6NEG5_9BASI|nr:hypothetical protein CROQUDRAFT_662135 [Cronartium quercuum f. sp. fusiforme G11]
MGLKYFIQIAEEFDTNTPDNQMNTAQESSEEEEEEEEEDIESMVAKELDQLKSLNSNKSLANRFNWKKMDCECLGFIQFPRKHDPITFSNHLIEQIQLGKIGYGLRHIQRITPVSATCTSTSIPAFKELVTKILGPIFGDRGLKYRIEPIIRCHDQPLNRTEVINIIGKAVDEFNVLSKHKVNLDQPEIVVLVSVYKYVVGISCVEHYDQRRKFNLQIIAEIREKAPVVDTT